MRGSPGSGRIKPSAVPALCERALKFYTHHSLPAFQYIPINARSYGVLVLGDVFIASATS
jgi:hypothetical protein